MHGPEPIDSQCVDPGLLLIVDVDGAGEGDLGGGTVDGYPEETDDRTVSGSFLHTGPMAAFENHGFTRTRPISPHRWVVTRTVEPA